MDLDLNALSGYWAPMIAGICLCVGTMIKKWMPDAGYKYIPTINGLMGLLLSIWMAGWTVTPDVILTGLFSGLASTGLYEAFRNLMDKKEK